MSNFFTPHKTMGIGFSDVLISSIYSVFMAMAIAHRIELFLCGEVKLDGSSDQD
jgi:hypothetical protein